MLQDEINNHINARYVSASELYWRIFSFPVHFESSPVVQLAINDEMDKPIYLCQDVSLEEALAIASV